MPLPVRTKGAWGSWGCGTGPSPAGVGLGPTGSSRAGISISGTSKTAAGPRAASCRLLAGIGDSARSVSWPDGSLCSKYGMLTEPDDVPLSVTGSGGWLGSSAWPSEGRMTVGIRIAVGVAAAETASPKRGMVPLPGGNHCACQSATPSSKRMGLRSAASNCPGSGAKRTKPKQSATVQKTVKVRINKTRTGDGGSP